MSKTFHLIRHGQSQANAGGVTLENPLVPLTELGVLQARALAPLLPASTPGIWSSPFKRAVDTAAPYCERHAKSPILHEDLREFETVDTFTLAGRPCSEREAVVARYWLGADIEHRTGPKGETFREFHERVARVRTELLPTLPDGAVVFGHGMWMALLFWQMWGFETIDTLAMTQFRRFQLGFPTPNAGVYAVTQLGAHHWDIRANEAAMRAIAGIGRGLDQRAHEDIEPLAV